MAEIKTIKAQQAKQLVDEGKAILVDVRDDKEHNEECIGCAHHIPLSKLTASKFAKETKTVIFHCRLGKRSLQAAAKALKSNPKLKVYSLEDGLEGWKHCGLPVEGKGGTSMVCSWKKCCMNPLCMPTAVKGALIVGGTVLGYWFSIFYLIPLLVGIGMLLKAYTGWCGMDNMIESCMKCGHSSNNKKK